MRRPLFVVQVLCHGSNHKTGKDDLPLLRRDQTLIGFLRPLGALETITDIAGRGVTSFSIELMPRTTRAQSMDALSSMATICGYKAVVGLSAENRGRGRRRWPGRASTPRACRTGWRRGSGPSSR